MIYIFFSMGLVIAYILGWLSRSTPVGMLRIDRSDPDEEPYFFLELESKKQHRLVNGSIVTLKVNTESYISHE